MFIQSYLAFCSNFPKVEQIMESHAQSVEDNLIDSLSFKLRPGASYVTDRRSCSYFSQGNQFSPSGVKVIKMQLNSADGWLDPSTVKLFMNIKNDGDEPITPRVKGAWGMFSRLRVLCSGAICEDIDHYGRLHEQFDMMRPVEKRANDAIEGFGDGASLAPGQERIVAFTPMSGLFTNNNKYLPVKYAPLVLELSLVASGDEAFSGKSPVPFTLSDVQLKADIVTLDSSLDNEYSAHLLEGKTLPIHFSTFTTASQVLTNLNSTVNISRALTRLKGVYVSLSTDASPIEGNDTTVAKEVNTFYHPMSYATTGENSIYNKNKELSFEMQIGAKKYPEYPLQSLAEQFYSLRKSLSIHDINASMNISASEYRTSKFVIGIDTQKVNGASFSGYNSKSGDLTVLRMKPLGSATLAGNCKIHYVLHYDSIMNIRDGGIEVLE